METINTKKMKSLKIKLADVEKLIDYYSSKASEYCHQLGIAGIVVIWGLQNYSDKNCIKNTVVLKYAFLLFVITITISLIHYSLLAYLSNRYFNKSIEENDGNGLDLDAARKLVVDDNKKIEKLSWWFFYLKLAALVVAYLITIMFIINNIF